MLEDYGRQIAALEKRVAALEARAPGVRPAPVPGLRRTVLVFDGTTGLDKADLVSRPGRASPDQ